MMLITPKKHSKESIVMVNFAIILVSVFKGISKLKAVQKFFLFFSRSVPMGQRFVHIGPIECKNLR
jgi:hypothetical protein